MTQSAYLFILALEVLFFIENIKGTEIFKHVFLYTAYADNSTFFLRYIPSVKELINNLNQFDHFSGLKSNIKKCEIVGLGCLKGVTKTVCGLKCVDLLNDTIKILSIHFSYKKKVQMQKSSNYITKIKNNTASSSFMEFTCAYP